MDDDASYFLERLLLNISHCYVVICQLSTKDTMSGIRERECVCVSVCMSAFSVDNRIDDLLQKVGSNSPGVAIKNAAMPLEGDLEAFP